MDRPTRAPVRKNQKSLSSLNKGTNGNTWDGELVVSCKGAGGGGRGFKREWEGISGIGPVLNGTVAMPDMLAEWRQISR